MAATEASLADATAPDAANAISEEEVSALLEKNSTGNVKPYEFTVLRINRTRLPMLEIVSKSFADRMGSSLSSLLGRDATVQFTALDSTKIGEVQAALPVPASLAIVRLKPLPGLGFVSVEPALLLTLLDGFFGGSGRAASDVQAAIAPAAQRFLALMLRSFAADFTAAWTPVAPLELELVKQETNPRLMHLGAPQDLMLVLKFTVEFGAHSGRIEWLLPETLLAPIREALASEGGSVPVRRQEIWAPVLGAVLQDAQLETRAVLAQAKISLGELVRLTTGDIIPIDAPQYVTLLAGDVPLYNGRFGVSQGRNALKILPGGPA
ncbi:MAG TPA: FliM/FliN family flagellar motor switch protein [Steroidobacteraceae bacterium]|jgi:flagellar motor switch protein FliM|nr:FliM/FliN family flagellar motor switch protein [Steroidobacteraceae bacterium]